MKCIIYKQSHGICLNLKCSVELFILFMYLVVTINLFKSTSLILRVLKPILHQIYNLNVEIKRNSNQTHSEPNHKLTHTRLFKDVYVHWNHSEKPTERTRVLIKKAIKQVIFILTFWQPHSNIKTKTQKVSYYIFIW